ncbi:hypothetical protein NDU88_000012 [Pleurodeles waltl]|uniref:Uncharacterized protein n=1 Tax=Pleurodeles waltl TaxID=8319 RepID=A0AAV7M181_PLEWA|nr:hypothetical protein NDU88_000012 [Pleurodeles waltl]
MSGRQRTCAAAILERCAGSSPDSRKQRTEEQLSLRGSGCVPHLIVTAFNRLEKQKWCRKVSRLLPSAILRCRK